MNKLEATRPTSLLRKFLWQISRSDIIGRVSCELEAFKNHSSGKKCSDIKAQWDQGSAQIWPPPSFSEAEDHHLSSICPRHPLLSSVEEYGQKWSVNCDLTSVILTSLFGRLRKAFTTIPKSPMCWLVTESVPYSCPLSYLL
jgi:hypothetical protein